METLSEAKDTQAAESEDDLVDHVYLYLKDSASVLGVTEATNSVEI